MSAKSGSTLRRHSHSVTSPLAEKTDKIIGSSVTNVGVSSSKLLLSNAITNVGVSQSRATSATSPSGKGNLSTISSVTPSPKRSRSPSKSQLGNSVLSNTLVISSPANFSLEERPIVKSADLKNSPSGLSPGPGISKHLPSVRTPSTRRNSMVSMGTKAATFSKHPNYENATIDNGRYIVGKLLGAGSFGQIHVGVDTHNNSTVAIKFETDEHPQLPLERKIYSLLHEADGFSKVYFFGKMTSCNILIMEKLGSNLEDLFESCNRRFTFQTVCLLALQILERIEFFHSIGYVHRDIKPQNFLIGDGIDSVSKSTIHLIDFGLSESFLDKNKLHVKFHQSLRNNGSVIGTARYASLNSHLGRGQYRRDDLESIGFMLIYFYCGSLPWQGIKSAPNADHVQRQIDIFASKEVCISKGTLFKDIPKCFKAYITYCRELEFDTNPDYNYLKNLFLEVYKKCKFPCIDDIPVYKFDWQKQDELQSSTPNVSSVSQDVPFDESYFKNLDLDSVNISINFQGSDPQSKSAKSSNPKGLLEFTKSTRSNPKQVFDFMTVPSISPIPLGSATQKAASTPRLSSVKAVPLSQNTVPKSVTPVPKSVTPVLSPQDIEKDADNNKNVPLNDEKVTSSCCLIM